MTKHDREKALKLAKNPRFRSDCDSIVGLLVDALIAAEAELEGLRNALRKIYTYRSDEPDWNMVMAIAEAAIEPKILVPQEKRKGDE